jgi:hypothetical protein
MDKMEKIGKKLQRTKRKRDSPPLIFMKWKYIEDGCKKISLLKMCSKKGRVRVSNKDIVDSIKLSSAITFSLIFNR